MRVVVSQLSTLGSRTGVGHYARELFRHLRVQARREVEGFPAGWVREACKPFVGTRGGQPGGGTARPGLRRRLMRRVRERGRAFVGWYFRARCRRRGYDLYHEPNFIPLACDVPTVATLHDLSVLVHPEWHPKERVAFHERHFRRGLERCTHFLAVSDFTRDEIVRLLGVRPERVTRTYNGVREWLRPRPQSEVEPVLRSLGLPTRYLLYVGTIEPRKNVLMLLRAYCALPASVRDAWPLLLVGHWGWNAGAVARYLDEEARHKGVIHVGYVRDRHLGALYSGARALAYPSWYEGFGLPAVEMLACGGAVLASTAGALAETVGGKAHLIDPADEAGWTAALARVATDDAWWSDLRAGAVEAAAPFTWERCAAETLGVYRRVTGRPATLPLPSEVHPARKAG